MPFIKCTTCDASGKTRQRLRPPEGVTATVDVVGMGPCPDCQGAGSRCVEDATQEQMLDLLKRVVGLLESIEDQVRRIEELGVSGK